MVRIIAILLPQGGIAQALRRNGRLIVQLLFRLAGDRYSDLKAGRENRLHRSKMT